MLPLVVDEVESLGTVVSEAERVTHCRKPFLWKEFWCLKIRHHICNDRVIVLSECSEELPIRIVLGSWRMVLKWWCGGDVNIADYHGVTSERCTFDPV